jgi:restriction endonuclease Mrr
MDRRGARIVGRVADKVVLIDGETLANLMIDHSVGVLRGGMMSPRLPWGLRRSFGLKRESGK